MLFYSQAVCVSTYFWFCHASFITLIAVYITGTVIYALTIRISDLGQP